LAPGIGVNKKHIVSTRKLPVLLLADKVKPSLLATPYIYFRFVSMDLAWSWQEEE
jgi:hypothetical protein